ncbi:hypothetical protein [Providencia rettgeri]|uniref:hypothetical protein n=1 Tax=Providencia rettgeri TaxID=587 RepID=UPI00155E6F99|nr:hypothetical protein [Providencia rettgeri]QKG44633.1 hypothetical protein HRD55_08570 [Providencia rettgeri]QNN34766.1 hypothetical protein H9X60_08575 [Providencia rettgeri]
MDKSRQQFEAWRSKNKSSTINLFDVWQASRESLEIELPEPFIANETWCYDEDLVNQALISNGVKIKNES